MILRLDKPTTLDKISRFGILISEAFVGGICRSANQPGVSNEKRPVGDGNRPCTYDTSTGTSPGIKCDICWKCLGLKCRSSWYGLRKLRIGSGRSEFLSECLPERTAALQGVYLRETWSAGFSIPMLSEFSDNGRRKE